MGSSSELTVAPLTYEASRRHVDGSRRRGPRVFMCIKMFCKKLKQIVRVILMASDGEDGTIDEGSVVSKSTNLVAEVSDLARGLTGVVKGPGYLTNLANLSFPEAVDTLYKSASGIVAELAAQVDDKVVHFTIGKAYVKKHASHKHLLSGAMKTWSLEGVLSRWKSYYRGEHFCGLIVLACATNKLCQGT